MRNVRTIKTARTPRGTMDIYTELNQPMKTRRGTPLAPNPPTLTPRPRVPQKKQLSDTTSFRMVDEHLHSVETIINTGRKTKAQQIQAWIDEFNPPPIEVLRKIAQVSQPHQHLLNLICDELEKFPPEKLKDPIHELNDDALDQISGIKSRSHDLEDQTKELKGEEAELRKRLKAAEENLKKTKEEYDRYLKLVEMSTFDEYKKEVEMKKKAQQVEMLNIKTSNDDESFKYNSIWGENNYLREETKKLQDQIEKQRKLHEEFNHRRAMKLAEKRYVPLKDKTKDEEFLNNHTVTPT